MKATKTSRIDINKTRNIEKGAVKKSPR